MEYTQEMYNEDLAISRYTFSKYFKHFFQHKEDFIQFSLYYLSRCRSKFDETRGSYGNLAFKTSKHAMCLYIHRYLKKESEVSMYSLDVTFDDEEKIYFADTLVDEYDFDGNLNCEFLQKLFEKVIQSKRSENFKKFSREYMQGLTITEIAHKYNVSRQCVSEKIQDFRNLSKKAYEEYVKDDLNA